MPLSRKDNKMNDSIMITDKTSIPFAPKARKIIEEKKKKDEERLD